MSSIFATDATKRRACIIASFSHMTAPRSANATWACTAIRISSQLKKNGYTHDKKMSKKIKTLGSTSNRRKMSNAQLLQVPALRCAKLLRAHAKIHCVRKCVVAPSGALNTRADAVCTHCAKYFQRPARCRRICRAQNAHNTYEATLHRFKNVEIQITLQHKICQIKIAATNIDECS